MFSSCFPFFSTSSEPLLVVTVFPRNGRPSHIARADPRLADLLGVPSIPEEKIHDSSWDIHSEWHSFQDRVVLWHLRHPDRSMLFLARTASSVELRAISTQSSLIGSTHGSVIRRASPEEAVYYRHVIFPQLEQQFP